MPRATRVAHISRMSPARRGPSCGRGMGPFMERERTEALNFADDAGRRLCQKSVECSVEALSRSPAAPLPPPSMPAPREMAFASGPSSSGFDAGASEVPHAFVRYIEDLVKALKTGHTAREDSGSCRCGGAGGRCCWRQHQRACGSDALPLLCAPVGGWWQAPRGWGRGLASGCERPRLAEAASPGPAAAVTMGEATGRASPGEDAFGGLALRGAGEEGVGVGRVVARVTGEAADVQFARGFTA